MNRKLIIFLVVLGVIATIIRVASEELLVKAFSPEPAEDANLESSENIANAEGTEC